MIREHLIGFHYFTNNPYWFDQKCKTFGNQR